LVPFADKDTAEAAELWFLRQRVFSTASTVEAADNIQNKSTARFQDVFASGQFDAEMSAWMCLDGLDD
jgi:hypothetical protein